ncbi:glycerate kinase [Chitinivorax sp. PXF-14]|uniref:glycerate kinase n=1 Tax=Chitinivorax sp. PXF-14 TaxID=3230488 RepID=UPI0034657410
MKIVIAPDSFKGSLSAAQVAQAVAEGVSRVWPSAMVVLKPMADGGEGTLDACAVALAARRQLRTVSDAEGRTVDAPILFAPGDIAVIESAQIVGLPMISHSRVAERSTAGVGLMLRHALDAGARRIMIGLGGTATNDGGIGLLAALGVVLKDAAGRTLAADLDSLATFACVDWSLLDARLAGAELVVMSDVDNPLCGPDGATMTFGPQKGVQPDELPRLDAALAHWAQAGDTRAGAAVSAEAGSGAAGGLGYALKLLGARCEAGAAEIADLIGLDDAIYGADWVITGEGRSDAQTLRGKVPYEVSHRARAAGVPVTLLSGALDRASLAELALLFGGCFSITDGPMTLDRAIGDAHELLANQGEQLARIRSAW